MADLKCGQIQNKEQMLQSFQMLHIFHRENTEISFYPNSTNTETAMLSSMSLSMPMSMSGPGEPIYGFSINW